MLKFASHYFRKILILFALISLSQGYANTSIKVFSKYPNPIFIETGSYYGGGIIKALYAGFKEIHSIELSPDLYNYCRQRFAAWPNVHLHLGDSPSKLKEILSQINQPVTFWLDAHYCTPESAKTYTPVLEELAVIATHPIKTHTILIDDVRLLGKKDLDFITLNQVIDAIRKINPKYEISFEKGVIPNDVLVARIRS